jgi:hypothetical protein
MFDGIFARPGGGMFSGWLDDPPGKSSVNGPPPWAAPGGDGFSPVSAANGAANVGGYLPVPVPFIPGTQTAAPSAGALSNGNPSPDPASGNDFLSRLGEALHDNSSMLMAMGGGMMTGGLGKGFQAGANAAADAASRRQAPQIVKVRRPDGGEALMMWDPGQRRYVPAPLAGLQPTGGSAPAVAATGGYAEGTTATHPQTGQRIILRNGQWQTM